MTREVFLAILKQTAGLNPSQGKFEVAPQNRLTIYLGLPGQNVLIDDIGVGVVDKEFVTLTTRETGTSFGVPYEHVSAVSHRPKDPMAERRAGFA